MAIARVKKIRILAHLDHRLAVMKSLQTMGLLELKEITPEAIGSGGEDPPGEARPPLEPYRGKEIREVEEDLSRVNHALELLQRHGSPPSLPAFQGPPTLSESEFEQLGMNYEFGVLVDRCHELEKELKQVYSRESHLIGLIETLSPWLDLDAPMSSLVSSPGVAVTVGIVSIARYQELSAALKDIGPLAEMETVNRGDKEVSVVIFAHNEVRKAVDDLLAGSNFHEVHLPKSGRTPAQAVAAERDELEKLKSKKCEIREEFSTLAGGPLPPETLEKLDGGLQWTEYIETVGGFITLQTVADYLRNRLSRREALGYLWRSRDTVILEGWINSRRQRTVTAELEKIAPEVDVTFEDPLPTEKVPSLLDNRSLVSPFEVLTDMYGAPNRKEFDPTPIMAPFFFICFGFCVTDAGYGAVLSIVMLLALKKLKLSRGMRQFFRLMLLGGISTLILGALTGGWFGDIFKQIADRNPDSFILGLPFKAADSITILDPIVQIIYFLGIALIVGLIQLTSGVIVKAVHNISSGDPLAAVLDQFTWILFVWGVVGYVPVRQYFPGHENIPVGMIISGAGLIIIGPPLLQLLHWQGFRSFSLSLGGGLWALYGTATGMMADILSYSRLFALGLATGILATVIDILAVMMWGMAPVLGWLLAIVILVVGHTFNILVQLLGAFIHSARLQFVEFFPKFFQGGGIPFKPFTRTLKNVYILPEVTSEN